MEKILLVAEEVIGLGIDEEITRHGAAAKEDRAFHVAAISEGQVDGKSEAAGESGGGADDDALLGVAGGVADDFVTDDGGIAGEYGAIAGDGVEVNGGAIGCYGNVGGMEGGGAGTAIGLGVPGKRAEGGEADPFVTAYDDAAAGFVGGGEGDLSRDVSGRAFGESSVGGPDSVRAFHEG